MRIYYFIVAILIISIVSFLYSINKSYESFTTNINIINLVLYSKDTEYDKMYELTKKYYKRFSNVKTIYYHFNENLNNDYELKDDILNIKGKETYIPGILDKTIKAFEYIDKNYNYDYLIRTNISTIVNFDLLTQYLQDNTIKYGGGFKIMITKDHPYLDLINLIYSSGTSIIFSKGTLTHFLNKKQFIRTDAIDDVSIGLLMRDHLPDIEQHYITDNRFIFIPDLNGDRTKLIDLIKNKSYIFYRNRQPDRKTDIKQMNIIHFHFCVLF